MTVPEVLAKVLLPQAFTPFTENVPDVAAALKLTLTVCVFPVIVAADAPPLKVHEYVVALALIPTVYEFPVEPWHTGVAKVKVFAGCPGNPVLTKTGRLEVAPGQVPFKAETVTLPEVAVLEKSIKTLAVVPPVILSPVPV